MINKIIPDKIYKEASIALSHYPELADVSIEFKFKPSLSTSFMKAQPNFLSLLKPKSDRSYIVFISEVFYLDGFKLPVENIPSKVLIGWLGHELGHIMDYNNRSSFNLALFGIKYVFSANFIRKAERTADTYAVTHMMKDYILATKKFILNNSSLSEKYKTRIKRLYLSPDEILSIAKDA